MIEFTKKIKKNCIFIINICNIYTDNLMSVKVYILSLYI